MTGISEWHQWLGLAGMVMIVSTYLLLQIERISSHHLSYSLLNAIGASLLVFSLVFRFNLGAMIIEAFWVLISLIGVARYFTLRRRTLESAPNHPMHPSGEVERNEVVDLSSPPGDR